LTVCIRQTFKFGRSILAKKSSSRTKGATSAEEANVVRIKAGDTKPKNEKTTKAPKEAVVTKVTKSKKTKATAVEAPAKTKKQRTNPLRAMGGYFKGAWVELRQVHWPTRRATWSLTVAVLIYTAFFTALILLLDALFKSMFEIILGK